MRSTPAGWSPRSWPSFGRPWRPRPPAGSLPSASCSIPASASPRRWSRTSSCSTSWRRSRRSAGRCWWARPASGSSARLTDAPLDQRDRATAVACALAWERGARIFRVHAVAAAREALALTRAVGARVMPLEQLPLPVPHWRDLVEILLVAMVLYRVLRFLVGTRALADRLRVAGARRHLHRRAPAQAHHDPLPARDRLHLRAVRGAGGLPARAAPGPGPAGTDPRVPLVRRTGQLRGRGRDRRGAGAAERGAASGRSSRWSRAPGWTSTSSRARRCRRRCRPTCSRRSSAPTLRCTTAPWSCGVTRSWRRGASCRSPRVRSARPRPGHPAPGGAGAVRRDRRAGARGLGGDRDRLGCATGPAGAQPEPEQVRSCWAAAAPRLPWPSRWRPEDRPLATVSGRTGGVRARSSRST